MQYTITFSEIELIDLLSTLLDAASQLQDGETKKRCLRLYNVIIEKKKEID